MTAGRAASGNREFLAHLAEHPIIAILRAPDATRFLDVSRVLYDAGCRTVEFTMTTAGALEAVATATDRLPRDMAVGVGTLRTAAQAEAAVVAGARFLVSQSFRAEVTVVATRLDVAYIPGALTPTEIVTAFDSGPPAVKVSPIGVNGGLAYFDELRAPMPDIPLLPTGAVRLDEVNAYLDRGAVAVGLSGSLIDDAVRAEGDLRGLARRTARTVERARNR